MGKLHHRNPERAQIAHLAARFMVEDGIEDYALAKRKAARAVGAADARVLPDNSEVEAALTEYRAIYEGAVHPARLQRLRETALDTMRDLAAFNPYLVGAVLRGTAGKFAGVQLQLFTGRAKAVEPFLMMHQAQYDAGTLRLYAGGCERIAPSYRFEREAIEIQVTVLDEDDIRATITTHPGGKAIERANAATVAALIALGVSAS